MAEQMSPVRLQAEALRDQRWSALEQALPELSRMVREGPSPGDGPLLLIVLSLVCGELHLRIADRLGTEEMYDGC